MSVNIAKLNVLLMGNVAGLTTALAQGRTEIAKFGDDTEKQAKRVHDAMSAGSAASQGFIKSLKSGLGEESTLGNFGKILAGTGAVAGLTLIGNQLAKGAAHAKDLYLNFKSGEASAAATVEDLAKGAPIIGGWVTAGRNLREVFDGTADAVARINAETKQIDRHTETLKRAADLQKTFADAVAASDKAAFEAGLVFRTDQDAARARIEAEHKARLEQIEKLQKALDTAPAANKGGLEAQLRQLQNNDQSITQAATQKLVQGEGEQIGDFVAKAHAAADEIKRAMDAGKIIDPGAIDEAVRTLQANAANLTLKLPLDADYINQSLQDALKSLDVAKAAAVYNEKLKKILDAVNKQTKEAAAAGRALWEETRTPAEKYAEQIARINDLLQRGAIDEDTAARARAKAKKELDQAQDPPHAAPAAVDIHSQAAATALANLAASAGAGGGSSTEQRDQQAMAERRKTNGHLEQISQNTRNLQPVTTVAIV